MTYIVYADMFLIYNISINLVLYLLIAIIYRQRIKIFHLILWASGTGIISLGSFLICLHIKLPYILIYATSYFFMTFFYIKSLGCSGSIKKCFESVFVSILLLSGFLHIFYRNRITMRTYVYIYPLVVILIKVYKKNLGNIAFIHQKKNNQYLVKLYTNVANVEVMGFIDTGNKLFNPYNHKPVIIVNSNVAKSLLPDSLKPIIEHYKKTGVFSYDNSPINIFPLPYKTISSDFALMPAFRVEKIEFCDSQKVYPHITAAISKKTFFDKENYQVLLHESLKPI